MEVGKRIRNLRKAKNMTVTELANASYISQSYLSDIETGRTTPSLDKLMIICNQLNISLSEFFGDSIGKSEDLIRLVCIAEKLSDKEIKALNNFLESITTKE